MVPVQSRTSVQELPRLLVGSILIPRNRSEVSQQPRRPKSGKQWGKTKVLGMSPTGKRHAAYRVVAGLHLRLSSVVTRRRNVVPGICCQPVDISERVTTVWYVYIIIRGVSTHK